jgi:ADP-heptose:LPS heptosyltransferase
MKLMKKTKIYTGILGQYGDIVMFTAIIKRIKQLIPHSEITFAISKKYGDIGPLLKKDPLINKVFITENYFDKLLKGNFLKRKKLNRLFNQGVYFDLRGEDEKKEQAKNDIVFETRPQHKDQKWFEKKHLIKQFALDIGINTDEFKTRLYPPEKISKKFNLKPHEYIVIHTKSAARIRSWNRINELKKLLPHEKFFIVQEEKTTISELATIIKNSKLFIGIDSMPIWIASSFEIPIIGLYGNLLYKNKVTHFPKNKHAIYLEASGHPNKISPNQIIKEIEKLIGGVNGKRI